MRTMGDKVSARRTAEAAGVPVAPGAEIRDAADAKAVLAAADRVGFPLLVKAARGGGGKGIRRVERRGGLAGAGPPAGVGAQDALRRRDGHPPRVVVGPGPRPGA